jgi:hypothetical protein
MAALKCDGREHKKHEKYLFKIRVLLMPNEKDKINKGKLKGNELDKNVFIKSIRNNQSMSLWWHTILMLVTWEEEAG